MTDAVLSSQQPSPLPLPGYSIPGGWNPYLAAPTPVVPTYPTTGAANTQNIATLASQGRYPLSQQLNSGGQSGYGSVLAAMSVGAVTMANTP